MRLILSHIVGTILRFSKGDYLAGVAGDLVPSEQISLLR